MTKRVILKEGKEKSLLRGHPWVFSGAIDQLPDCKPGDIFPIFSASGEFLAQGYFHPTNSIAGRILSFTQEAIETVLEQKILDAIVLRKRLFDSAITNAYRIINAEGDGIPGLIVDQYGPYLVIQVASAGIERLKSVIIELLIRLLQPKAIYEKSTSGSRKEEGLQDAQELLYGPDFDEVQIIENQLPFLISVKNGQKTGFFLDQREMRKMITSFSKDLKVLNCFSYTGGFSVYALHGKATHVDMVEIDQTACQLCEKNLQLNHCSDASYQIMQGDAFDFLAHESLDYDLVILDPPAFAKKRKELDGAIRGYREINLQALKKMPKRSYLLTSSCSQHIDEGLFQQTVFQAALKAGRQVKILSRHQQAPDHPVSLYHPEGAYLKSLFLYVE